MLFSGQAGARAELEFRGSAIDLEILEGPGSGMARIWIDGSDARADLVPKSAGGVARLDLYATESGFAAVPLASGLPSGLHRMTLEVVGTRAPDSAGELVMIRAAIAGEPAPRWPIWLGTAAAAAGAALALGSLLNWWSGRWRWRPVIERVQIADAPALLLAAVLLTLVATIPAAGPGIPGSGFVFASLAALGLLGTAAPAALATVTVAGWLLAPVAVPLGPLNLNPGELGLAALTGAWGVRAILLGRVEFGIASRHLPLLLLFLGAALAATAAAEYPKVAVRGLRLLVLEPLWLGCLVATYLVGRRPVAAGRRGRRAAGIAACAGDALGRDRILRRRPVGPPARALGLAERLGAGARKRTAAGPGPRPCRSRGEPANRVVGAAAGDRGRAAGYPVARRLAGRSGGGGGPGPARLGRGASVSGPLAGAAGRPCGRDWIGDFGIGRDSALTPWTCGCGFGGSAALMAGDNLWLGVGPDNFLYRLPDYLDPQMWREPNLSHPHNLLLDAWLSIGVAGVAALALLLTRSVSVIARGLNARGGVLFWADAGILAAMAAGVAHGLLDNFYFRPELAAFFWLFVAYSFAVERDPQGEESPGGPAAAGRPQPESAA